MTGPSVPLRRRDVLRTAAAPSVAAVAGCANPLDGDGPPAYGEATPGNGANEDDGVFFVHVDTAWLREFDGEEEPPYAEKFPDGETPTRTAIENDVGTSSREVTVDTTRVTVTGSWRTAQDETTEN